MCVERQTELTAERVGWTDLHRAADPAALVRYHDLHGVAGPASADYRDHLATFGTLAAEHDVVVWARSPRPAGSGWRSGRDARVDHRRDA